MEPWQIAKRIGEGILRRRKRLAVATIILSGVILGSVAYYVSREPPRYRTTATILLESRPDRVPLFQEFSPFRPFPVQLAILRSRGLSEGVLESLSKASLQELVDNPYYVDYVQKIKNLIHRFRGEELEVDSPQRRALKELQNARVQFIARGDTGIVDISAEASKPQVAIDIANAYVEVLLSRTRSFNIDDSRVTREFLEQQVAETRKKLQASEESLGAFTAGHGGVRIPDQSQATVTRLAQAEMALAEVTASRKMIEVRLQGLREKVESQKRNAPPTELKDKAPPQAEGPRPVAPSVARARDQLSKLETALIDLRTRYTDQHPRVIRAREQIADLQQELGTAVKETTQVTAALDAVPPAERVNFTEQVVALETSLQVLTAQEDALQKEAGGLRLNLGGLSRSENDYVRLQREVDSNRSLNALLSDRLTAARIREQGEMKVVKVIDSPGFPTAAPNAKRLQFGGLALLLAICIGGGLSALVEWRKRPVESEEDVASVTGLPVLAVFPHLAHQVPLVLSEREYREMGAPMLGENFLFNEGVHNLRVAIQLASRGKKIRTLMITSAFPGEGKSTILVNLGLELGAAGQRVVLADTDFLRPTLHEILEIRPKTGLVEVLLDQGNIGQSLAPVRDGVRLMARGPSVHRETRRLLTTERLKGVLGELRDDTDFVLCDSSPVLLISDNLFLAAAVDAVILVARVGSTGCRDLARARTMLDEVGAGVVGVVLNDMPVSRLRRYYKRYKRYYKGYYGKLATSEAS